MNRSHWNRIIRLETFASDRDAPHEWFCRHCERWQDDIDAIEERIAEMYPHRPILQDQLYRHAEIVAEVPAGYGVISQFCEDYQIDLSTYFEFFTHWLGVADFDFD